jgi:hypothetical protein
MGRDVERSGRSFTGSIHLQELLEMKKKLRTGGRRFMRGVPGHEGNPWLVVRKRTIPTERPPLVGEVTANFSG